MAWPMAAPTSGNFLAPNRSTNTNAINNISANPILPMKSSLKSLLANLFQAGLWLDGVIV
jgi:hypothetical protein